MRKVFYSVVIVVLSIVFFGCKTTPTTTLSRYLKDMTMLLPRLSNPQFEDQNSINIRGLHINLPLSWKYELPDHQLYPGVLLLFRSGDNVNGGLEYVVFENKIEPEGVLEVYFSSVVRNRLVEKLQKLDDDNKEAYIVELKDLFNLGEIISGIIIEEKAVFILEFSCFGRFSELERNQVYDTIKTFRRDDSFMSMRKVAAGVEFYSNDPRYLWSGDMPDGLIIRCMRDELPLFVGIWKSEAARFQKFFQQDKPNYQSINTTFFLGLSNTQLYGIFTVDDDGYARFYYPYTLGGSGYIICVAVDTRSENFGEKFPDLTSVPNLKIVQDLFKYHLVLQLFEKMAHFSL